MEPGGLPVLSRLERCIVVGVVASGVVVLVAGVAAFLIRDRIEVWLTGDEVAAAQRTAMTVELPAALEDDPTRSACSIWTALRCAWSVAPPQEAAQLMVDALAGAGLGPGDVVCGDPTAMPDALVAADAVCVAEVAVAGERLWVVATDRTPVGEVPLGRTATWVTWDESAMSWPMVERLQGEWDGLSVESYPPLTPAEVADALPERLVAVLDGTCRGYTSDVCSEWTGPVDISDLGDDPVAALVAELTAAGYFVDAADPDWSSEGVRAHRFVDGTTRRGVSVSVHMEDGVPVARAFAH